MLYRKSFGSKFTRWTVWPQLIFKVSYSNSFEKFQWKFHNHSTNPSNGTKFAPNTLQSTLNPMTMDKGPNRPVDDPEPPQMTHFDPAPGRTFVPLRSQVEQPLVFAQGAVAVAHLTDGLVFGQVRALGRLQFHFGRALLGPKTPWPLVVVDVGVHIVEAIVTQLLLATAVPMAATTGVKTPPVHIKHVARFSNCTARPRKKFVIFLFSLKQFFKKSFSEHVPCHVIIFRTHEITRQIFSKFFWPIIFCFLNCVTWSLSTNGIAATFWFTNWNTFTEFQSKLNNFFFKKFN